MTIHFFSFFKKIARRFSSKETIFFWYRRYKVFFFLGFLIILLIGVWNWYQNLYQYRFSDEEKQQYINSYFKETTFNESKFRSVVDDLTIRAQMHENVIPPTRNIFEGKGIQPKQ